MIKNKYFFKLLFFLLILTGFFLFLVYLSVGKSEIPVIIQEDEITLPEQKPEGSQVSMNTVSNNQVSMNTISNHDASNEEASKNTTSANKITENNNETSKNTLSTNETSTSSNHTHNNMFDRFTYKENFYYEPLSSVVIEQINGVSYKENDTIFYDDLSYINVLYVDFNGETQVGELISNRQVANDLIEIFYQLYIANYQIDKIKLIDEYQADDDLSCMDNNTSSFNYRTVGGTNKLSKHGLGLAIDINPVYNPYVTYPQGNIRITPPGSEIYADRTLDFPHKIDEDDLCYQLFIEYGWTWGGNWKNIKDYQHFQKELD